jgi:hypothetical protein
MIKLVMSLVLLTWMSAVLALRTSAQTPKGYTLGDAVANFQVKNVDGRVISLADYRSQKGLIVVFTSNHCPFSKAYEDRLIALDRMFAPQGYPVLAIMPNDPTIYEDDSFDNMKIRFRDKGYSYPYGMDNTAGGQHVWSNPDPAGIRTEADERTVYTGICWQHRRQSAG